MRFNHYIFMFLVFLNTILFSILFYLLYPVYIPQQQQQSNPLWALYFLAVLIIFTLILLFLIKKNRTGIFKGIFYFVTALVLFMILDILLSYVPIINEINVFNIFYLSDIIAIILSIIIPLYLWLKNSWIIINIVGIMVSGGIATLIAMSISILPIIILLVILAIYDFIAVFKSKHMITLAEGAVKSGIPAMFVYTDEENIEISETMGTGKAFFMGFGDAAIPTIMVVSSYINFGLYSAILTATGGFVGLIILFIFAEKQRPLPGLPFLNSGVILGFLISLL